MHNRQVIPTYATQDYEGMRKAGLLTAQVLDHITDYVVDGVTTQELNDICNDMIIANGAISATVPDFPKETCISTNHIVCHGIPSDKKKLKNGDIVNIDVCLELDGWHGDSSRMYCVGKSINPKAKKLIQTTYDAMMYGIEKVKDGANLNDIGKTIQEHVDSQGFSVVRDFCGHGIGRVLHDPALSVLHFDCPSESNIILKEGMFFTVEPMINAGQHFVKILNDNWTAVTKDKSLSAQFEHTIAVTCDGFEIFTLSPKGFTNNL